MRCTSIPQPLGREAVTVECSHEGLSGVTKTDRPENKLAAYTARAQQPTSWGHQHWVCTSLGRSAPLPHPSYQDW